MNRRLAFLVAVLCTVTALGPGCTTTAQALDGGVASDAREAAAETAAADVAGVPDSAATEARADEASDILPDVLPDVLPDAARDLAPEAQVDATADVELDLAPDAGADLGPEPIEVVETEADVASACTPAPRPVIFVHGVNGSSANYATMIARLVADGWPAEYLFAFDAADPKWGCNVDNAAAIHQLVEHALAVTGQDRVDLVAHSMGTLSSRYYVKNLGGQTRVNTYVTLGGMHHGLSSPCWSPIKPCVWDELCQSGAFIAQLNADPATPGNLNWVSIYGTADETVPNESSHLEGAENIALEGIEHDGANGLQERIEAYDEVKRVLSYPCW